MPNWCHNKLTVTHEYENMVHRFVSAYMDNKLCSEFLPPIGEDTNEWRLANWGQKWDIGPGKDEEYGLYPTVVNQQGSFSIGAFDCEASVTFSSAWSPPVGLYERLVVLGFDVQASYFEPGMGFAGIWNNDEDIMYEGNWKEFPQELIDLYDIVEYNKQLAEER